MSEYSRTHGLGLRTPTSTWVLFGAVGLGHVGETSPFRIAAPKPSCHAALSTERHPAYL
ncbi:hypothetical protein [Catellatospora sichuanensis]|uniref:hypothetical protein n=1 Tax=Catellatospora sichuanensis TaxID=1969805 RepID=UPI001C916673|nr:hypothetical protein [Catellatospora sichuanensis]